MAIYATSNLGGVGGGWFFTYESYVTINAEAHQFLAYYGEAMGKNQKFSKFLYGINSGPMKDGKSNVIADLKMSNMFTLTTYYLYHSFQKKNKIYSKETSELG